MATVRELSALCEGFLLAPRRGPGVCERCFNLTDGFQQCYRCANCAPVLNAIAPISYSVAHEQLHHTLATYKQLTGDLARRLGTQLAAVLWRYLAGHEACIARAAGGSAEAGKFALVTTVPSGDPGRDDWHPLRSIVGGLVGPTRERYEPILRRTWLPARARTFNPDKYTTVRALDGESVLLIDDTWTTGANAQSAAAALKASGAGPVAALVIGRHVTREWHQNDRRLKALAKPFDWGTCALCAPAG